MAILVCGASSQIGHFLLPRLAASGETVLALSRRPRAAQAGVTWLRGALPDAMPPLPALSALISFGPLQAFADWLAQAGIGDAPRVIVTSSMSAQSKRDSVVPAERVLAQRLRDGEAALARACAARGCAWTVLRPTLVYGAGLDKSLTPIARRALRTRVFPLPAGRGLRQRHPDQCGDGRLVHDVAGVIDQSVLAVRGVGIERNIADQAKLRPGPLQRTRGAMHEVVGVPRLGGVQRFDPGAG